MMEIHRELKLHVYGWICMPVFKIIQYFRLIYTNRLGRWYETHLNIVSIW